MSNNIQLIDSNDNSMWKKNYNSSQEILDLKDYCKSRETVNFLFATFKPVRTHNVEVFAKDFFLPTTINHAIKVQNVVGKIFAILGSLILDFLTFPIRVITCVPRAISNSKQVEHPLLKFFKDQGVDSKLFESNYSRVRLEWVTTDNSGTKIQNYEEMNVNFIELPDHPGCCRYNSGEHSI